MGGANMTPTIKRLSREHNLSRAMLRAEAAVSRALQSGNTDAAERADIRADSLRKAMYRVAEVNYRRRVGL